MTSREMHFWQLGFSSSYFEPKQKNVSDRRRHGRNGMFVFAGKSQR